MLNIQKILIAITSLLFLMIGFFKFFPFMEPACTMMDRIPSSLWMWVECHTTSLAIISGAVYWNIQTLHFSGRSLSSGVTNKLSIWVVIEFLLLPSVRVSSGIFLKLLIGASLTLGPHWLLKFLLRLFQAHSSLALSFSLSSKFETFGGWISFSPVWLMILEISTTILFAQFTEWLEPGHP